MSKRQSSYHVIPHPDGGWAVKRTGSHRAMKVFDTKKQATTYARDVVNNKSGKRFVIHGRDGIVQKEVTSGRDPSPSRSRHTRVR